MILGGDRFAWDRRPGEWLYTLRCALTGLQLQSGLLLPGRWLTEVPNHGQGTHRAGEIPGSLMLQLLNTCGTYDSCPLQGEGRQRYRGLLKSSLESLGHGEQYVLEMRPAGGSRALLQPVRRGHYGQRPQPLLRQTEEETSRPARETATSSGADVPHLLLAASPVHSLTPAAYCLLMGGRRQLSARKPWKPTITSGSTAAPSTGPSAPWSETTWSIPRGAGPTTPCPMDVCIGTPARSCSAWTAPSASPCPRRWSTGACPSSRSTWPPSSWPTKPGPSARRQTGQGHATTGRVGRSRPDQEPGAGGGRAQGAAGRS